ncbi:MAG: hypothetical protein IJV32_05195 [Bacteroidales bacterium]|nr:hypothetical protein [Bacteroidales bacterium]
MMTFDEMKADFKAKFGTSFDFLKDTGIYETPLYKFLERMPKGADLHAHADAILPMDLQVEFLKDHPELVITPDWQIRFIGPGAPYGSRNMKECLEDGLTVEDFRRVWTVGGAPRNGYVWDWFEGIFTKCGAICTTPALVQDYYTRVMLYYHSIGVEHLELRSPFFGTREDAQARAEAYIRALAAVRKVAPLFTLSIVACAGKNDAWDPLFDLLMDNAVWVWKNVKDGDYDLVKAIDIVNDEDRSYSLARYEDRIRKILVENPGLRLTLHAGESLRGENEEITIALRCGINRLGHGFNLYRYPEAEKAVLEKGICMEICPVSNAMLGYCRDFSQHPAKRYMESGIPIVICSDDAAYQAHSVLTGDYLAVVVGWDLSFKQLRNLCRNSIEYSFLIPERKRKLMSWWKKEWTAFYNSSENS